jgi:hypothetical protein
MTEGRAVVVLGAWPALQQAMAEAILKTRRREPESFIGVDGNNTTLNRAAC